MSNPKDQTSSSNKNSRVGFGIALGVACARKGCQALAQAAVPGGVIRAEDGAGASTR